MAPEQMEQTNVGRRVDVWAIGGVALLMATGDPPWKVNKTTPKSHAMREQNKNEIVCSDPRLDRSSSLVRREKHARARLLFLSSLRESTGRSRPKGWLALLRDIAAGRKLSLAVVVRDETDPHPLGRNQLPPRCARVSLLVGWARRVAPRPTDDAARGDGRHRYSR